MWPKSRPSTIAYAPLSSPSEPVPSLWPTAPIPTSTLLHGATPLPTTHLLNGATKIKRTLLLGGNTPIAEHLLLRPNLADKPTKEDPLDEDPNETGDFSHLDYLETTDSMPLTSRRRQLPRVSLRSAMVGATVVVLLVCAVAVWAVVGGPERPLGREDYR